MAHLSDRLPWDNLQDTSVHHFECIRKIVLPEWTTAQSQAIEEFSQAFNAEIQKSSQDLQTEINEALDHDDYELHLDEEVVLPDIRTAMEHCRNSTRELQPHRGTSSAGLQYDHEKFDPFEMAALIHLMSCGCCGKTHGRGWVMDDIKLCLMYGEMLRLHRLFSDNCEQPQIGWSYISGSSSHEYGNGWKRMINPILHAYIALNVLLERQLARKRKSQTCGKQDAEEPQDYRLTWLYQRAVFFITAQHEFDVHAMPHRLFFGVPQTRTNPPQPDSNTGPPFGNLTIEKLFKCMFENKYPLTANFLTEITQILQSKRLPPELILMILKYADMTEVTSILPEPFDPLHPANRQVLTSYLAYCWKVLVRCECFVNRHHGSLVWDHAVRNCIDDLFFDRNRHSDSALAFGIGPGPGI